MGIDHAARPLRLFPSQRRSEKTSVPLSILDATCARFSDTGAVWLFDAPSAAEDLDGNEIADRLESSFVNTLNDFPQWAGQLHWAPFRPGGGHHHHTERFQRCMLTYGGSGDDCSDPGVDWSVVRRDYALDSIAPPVVVVENNLSSSPSSRSGCVWDNDAFPQEDLVSAVQLALANLRDDFADRPCMSVQITLFACGGYGVGVRLAHPVADAQSMMVFMHKWAANCRGRSNGHKHQNLSSKSSSSSLFGEPVFDPPRLDARAAGDIDAPEPDPDLCARARALPLHRFSWWDTDAPGYSPYLVGTTQNNMPPPEIMMTADDDDDDNDETTTNTTKLSLSPSTTAPWHTWDLDRPVASVVLHFTGDELARLRERARTEAAAAEEEEDITRETSTENNSNISRSDALLAHLFRLITQARCSVKSSSSSACSSSSYKAPAADDEVFLNFTLEARRRVNPPLPETFLGSPLFLTHIKASASSILFSSSSSPQQPQQQPQSRNLGGRQRRGSRTMTTTTTSGALARRLRKTLQEFTPDAVAALLHEAAFEVAPQRLWRGFLGSRHVIVTSWLRTRPYDVDFGIYGNAAGGGGDDGVGGSGAKRSKRRRTPAARYVHAVMGKADGIVVLLDPPVVEEEKDAGVDVVVYLDAEAMVELRDLVKMMPI